MCSHKNDVACIIDLLDQLGDALLQHPNPLTACHQQAHIQRQYSLAEQERGHLLTRTILAESNGSCKAFGYGCLSLQSAQVVDYVLTWKYAILQDTIGLLGRATVLRAIELGNTKINAVEATALVCC